MPLMKRTRRAVLGPSRALPFCLSLWLAPTAIDVPILDLLPAVALALGSPVLDVPEIGIAE
jgi:hypothetical protein